MFKFFDQFDPVPSPRGGIIICNSCLDKAATYQQVLCLVCEIQRLNERVRALEWEMSKRVTSES